MKEKNRFFIMIISALVVAGFALHKTAAHDESFVIERKGKKSETSRQLKEKLIVLLEEVAHAQIEVIQVLSSAQKQLLYRMHELLEDSDGPFSTAPHSVLKQRVAEAEKLRDNLKVLTSCVADLNTFLKKQ